VASGEEGFEMEEKIRRIEGAVQGMAIRWTADEVSS
jgi:hypothetical protein